MPNSKQDVYMVEHKTKMKLSMLSFGKGQQQKLILA